MGAGHKKGLPDVRDVQGIIIKTGKRYGDGTRDSNVYLKDVVGTKEKRCVKLGVLLRDGQKIQVFNIGGVPIQSKELEQGDEHYDEYMSELANWEYGHPGLNDRDKWHVFLIDRDDLPADVMHDFSTRIKIKPR